MDPKRIYIVEDDLAVLKLEEHILKSLGWEVKSSTSAEKAYSEIINFNPSCILLDIMLPGMDGLEFCKMIRSNKDFNDVYIIIVSLKAYNFDKERALSFGADGYITKPFNKDKFEKAFNSIISINLEFWGIRGTLPVPGKRAIKYGGNTSCVTVRFSQNRWFIFDAGTGIKEFSDYLMKAGQNRIKANLFISHSHWDHINAFPFFAPLYIPGNEIIVYGPYQSDNHTMRKVISDQMFGIYFPIGVKEFAAHVDYKDLREGSYDIDGIEVKTKLLTHPGNCLGYRINYKAISICYVTDNELYLPDSEYFNSTAWEQLKEFIEGADILIHDSTYFDDEYKKKVNWGHSCVSQVVKLAHEASIKKLYLYHQEPDQTDADLEKKLKTANKLLTNLGSSTICLLPVEKEEIMLR
ncbi:MAG: response regulator [bacterium]